jgi:hypothetical protein
MPIGDQKCGDKTIISASELRSKYDGLIKEAISKARPDLLITRSDDIASPGTITLAILDRLMNSDYVVADITYPNPNVFYELGIRHTCRTGTILIKEKKNSDVPFDVFHLRHIDYEDTGTGLKKLSEDLNNVFSYIDEYPDFLDNQVLEVASFKQYKFLKFDNEEEVEKNKQISMINAIIRMMAHPDIMHILTDKSIPDDQKGVMAIQELIKYPEDATVILGSLADAGAFNSSSNKPRIASRATNGRKTKH